MCHLIALDIIEVADWMTVGFVDNDHGVLALSIISDFGAVPMRANRARPVEWLRVHLNLLHVERVAELIAS